VPPHLLEKLPCREALYYGLLEHVRVARWARSTGTAPTSRPQPPGTTRPSAPCPTAGATSCTAARCTCTTGCSTSAARSRSTTRRSMTRHTSMRARSWSRHASGWASAMAAWSRSPLPPASSATASASHTVGRPSPSPPTR
jgi:hypothetical protein